MTIVSDELFLGFLREMSGEVANRAAGALRAGRRLLDDSPYPFDDIVLFNFHVSGIVDALSKLRADRATSQVLTQFPERQAMLNALIRFDESLTELKDVRDSVEHLSERIAQGWEIALAASTAEEPVKIWEVRDIPTPDISFVKWQQGVGRISARNRTGTGYDSFDVAPLLPELEAIERQASRVFLAWTFTGHPLGRGIA